MNMGGPDLKQPPSRALPKAGALGSKPSCCRAPASEPTQRFAKKTPLSHDRESCTKPKRNDTTSLQHCKSHPKTNCHNPHVGRQTTVAHKRKSINHFNSDKCWFPTLRKTIAKSEVPDRLRLRVDIHQVDHVLCRDASQGRPETSELLQDQQGELEQHQVRKIGKKARQDIELSLDMLMDSSS